MSGKIFDCVRSFPKRHLGRRPHYTSPKSLRMIEMSVDVVNAYEDILVDLTRAWRTKLRA